MFETNIQKTGTLISLAKAAEITGYHQDYLGQLCRLGRLPAKKVGRNWFTTSAALKNFSTPLNEAIEDAIVSEQEVVEPVVEVKPVEQLVTPIVKSTPNMSQTVVVSQVEGLPIEIRTLSSHVHHANSVQTMASNMRIKALQQEVLELRQLLTRLMTEVARHSRILDEQTGRNTFSHFLKPQDSLRHQYASNFDFNLPDQQTSNIEEVATQAPQIWSEPKPQFSVITWMAAAASLAAMAYLGTGMITGSFWGSEAETRTVYYHEVKTPNTQLAEPAVAGASDAPVPQIRE